MRVKRILLRRRKSRKENNPQSIQITEGALKIWRSLPEQIRHDPSLAYFRQEHERVHGDVMSPRLDPLPLSDVKKNVRILESERTFPQIGIHVSNEDGTVETLDTRDIENNNNEQPDEMEQHTTSKARLYLQCVKIGLLLVVWGMFTGFLMSTGEHTTDTKLLTIPAQNAKSYIINKVPYDNRLGVTLRGPFLIQEYQGNNNKEKAATINATTTASAATASTPPTTIIVERPFVTVLAQRLYYNERHELTHTVDISDSWRLELVAAEFMDIAKESTKTTTLMLQPPESAAKIAGNFTRLRLHFSTNVGREVGLQMSYDESPIYKKQSVIYAALVLCGLYVMIVWEIVNRTFAAIIASTLSVGILAALNSRPSMTTIMGWIDVETLLLLFGMMILVAILSETGIFDYLAVYAYKITHGHIWPLINCLCLFTAVLSSFLDNVTTVLLMTPVTIRLCEVMSLNPVSILMCMVIFSNIGGSLTPVGDPPNVIIASNSYISSNGVSFAVFTLHMLPGVLMVMLQTYLQLRFKFRHISDLQFKGSPEIEELRHEIHVWKRAAQSLSSYSKDEDLVRDTLMKKVNRLKGELKKKMRSVAPPPPNYQQTLDQLQKKYPIRNKPLLLKSTIALVFVITLFFLHSVPELQRLSLGWTALLGAILLLILADVEDMEAILARVEWSTLLFFAALFILMEALSELGLIEWIGNMTENIILGVSPNSRLTVAVLLILWVSAIASAFVDNIPLTTMMVKIIVSLAQNDELSLPLQPLVWALAFGACLGGNGTLIGASANVVCAGVAEQHGYKFTFLGFFKVGFVVMIGSIVITTGYLMVAHVAFTWH